MMYCVHVFGLSSKSEKISEYNFSPDTIFILLTLIQCFLINCHPQKLDESFRCFRSS